MKIRVLAFASAGDALGAGEVELELPAGSRVADLRVRLAREFPRLEPLWPRLAVAVDGRLAGTDEALVEGAEVALLPPVSGGSGRDDGTGAGAPRTGPEGVAAVAAGSCAIGLGAVGLVDGPLDAGAVMDQVRGPGRGAAVLFLGTVRDHHAGRRVEKLTYSAYRAMALEVLARIVSDLEAASPHLRAAILHRLGEVPAGDPSVAIAIAAPHRAEAYAASRTALERLKAEAPIWKREHYEGGGAAWREEEPLAAPTD